MGKDIAQIADAVANPPSNIHVEIEDRTDRFTNVVTDGTKILGTNATDIYIYSNSLNDTPIMDVFTKK